jgi:uncharacterized membrane protein
MPGPNHSSEHSRATTLAARENIQTVAELERDFLEHRRTTAERAGDAIGGFVGSSLFVTLQVVFLASWILVNLGLVPGPSPFDKPPFPVLQLVVGIESIFLLTFVLMRENRMRRQAEQRDHLHFQVNLISEQKASEAIRLLLAISQRLGIEEAGTEETERLAKRTDVPTLEREMDQHMPNRK